MGVEYGSGRCRDRTLRAARIGNGANSSRLCCSCVIRPSLAQQAGVEAGAADQEVVARPFAALVAAPGLTGSVAVRFKAAMGQHTGAGGDALVTDPGRRHPRFRPRDQPPERAGVAAPHRHQQASRLRCLQRRAIPHRRGQRCRGQGHGRRVAATGDARVPTGSDRMVQWGRALSSTNVAMLAASCSANRCGMLSALDRLVAAGLSLGVVPKPVEPGRMAAPHC